MGRRGQVMVYFVFFAPLLLLMILFAFEISAVILRVQETAAAADLAAHAGVQAIGVDDAGNLIPRMGEGEAMARDVFLRHRLPHAHLREVRCGTAGRRVACRVTAETSSPGWFPLVVPQRIQVSAVAYMVPGATRGDQ